MNFTRGIRQMKTQDPNERRRHKRVVFSTRIYVSASGIEIDTPGDSRDLSLKGVFVKTDKSLAKETPCHVKVVLTGGVEEITLNMKARVARIESNGVGIAFDSMDLDSYTHLKNIIRYNSDSIEET